MLLFTQKAEAQAGLSISVAVIANSTCEYNNGRLFATAANGAPPYTYSIDGGIHYQNSGYFAHLPSGDYTIIVKDALGATASGTATLFNNFNPPRIYVTYTNPSSCLASDATITATTSGGNPPYEYSMDLVHWQISGVFSNLPKGLYNVWVRDANGCISSAYGPWITLFNCPGGASTSHRLPSCNNKGEIYAEGSGGTPPYTYSLDGINFQSSGTFTNLEPGIYKVYIKDASGILYLYGVLLYSVCGYSININETHANCINTFGSITAQAQAGTPPYTYSLDGINFQTSGVFPNLSPGNYTVIAKDANGTLTSILIPIYNSCISLSAISTNTTCGGNNGSITATVSNGSAPYQYSIDGINFQNSNVFSPLPAGNYQVTVRDANGFTATASAAVLAGVNNLGLTTITQPTTCLLTDGSFTINATGGTPPYEYSKDGINYQNSNVFSGLPYGNYQAIVRDANGCMFSIYPTIVPFICLKVTATTTDAICGNNNGQITANAANGIESYQYSINGGIDFQSSSIFSALAPGTYTVTAKDAANSIATTQITISNSCISINSTVVSSKCGNANGSIQITASNGTGPYTYSLDGNTFQSSNIFNNLIAGTYTVTVKDANGLTSSLPVIINDIAGPQLTAGTTGATCDNNNGSITALATGGTTPLQYSITGTNFQNSNSFINIGSGDYTVLVKDANGCVTSYLVTVPLINDLTLIPGTDPTICEGSTTTLSVTSNGNNFTWSPAASLNNSTLKNPSASPSVTTQYTIMAKKGVCSQTKSMTVYVNPSPVADAGQGSVICFGKDSHLSGSGGITYSWTPATYLSNPAIANPTVVKPAGTITYSLKVTDGNNCQSLNADQVTITVTPPAKLFVGNDTSVGMNQPFPLQAIDINNSGFTQYTWSPSYGLSNPYIANPSAILDRDIIYQVTARTDAGCEGTDQISIKVYKGPDIYVPNSFTPNADGHNDILKAIPIGIKEFKYFAVYNRWGQQVFRSSTPNQGWDGKLKSVIQNNSHFVWVAEGVDDKGNVVRRKGNVLLIR